MLTHFHAFVVVECLNQSEPQNRMPGCHNEIHLPNIDESLSFVSYILTPLAV